MIRTGMKTFKSESRYIARHAGLIVPPGCAPLQVTQYFPLLAGLECRMLLQGCHTGLTLITSGSSANSNSRRRTRSCHACANASRCKSLAWPSRMAPNRSP